jgi:hypothetical protein
VVSWGQDSAGLHHLLSQRLPFSPGNFNGQMSLVAPEATKPFAPYSPIGVSSVLVLLFTLMELGLKHRAVGAGW